MNKNYYLIATVLIIIILFPSYAKALLSKDCYKDLPDELKEIEVMYIDIQTDIDKEKELTLFNDKYIYDQIIDLSSRYGETYRCLRNKSKSFNLQVNDKELPIDKKTMLVRAYLDINKAEAVGGYVMSMSYNLTIIDNNNVQDTLLSDYDYSNTKYYENLDKLKYSLRHFLAYLTKIPNHRTGQFVRLLNN